MTKKEFYKKLQEYGIVINGYKYQIVIGELRPVSYYLGLYKEDGKWLIYEVGDRGSIVYYYKGTDENEAFDKFYNDILIRLDDLGYMSKSITEDVIQTPKYYVYNFLQKKYNISKSDAEDTWNYLLHDFRILNEVKYFALNDKFVPSNDCYKVEGYSAQDIYEMSQEDSFSTHLTEIGAYNYLIYLDKHPEQALKDLKNGLPRK